MNQRSEKPVVLVSGFGAFGEHTTNSSWTGVQELSKRKLDDKLNIEMVTVEIPVVYEKVDELVPNLWEKHAPKLVVHVGESAGARMLKLEAFAHGHEYQLTDEEGKSPPNAKNSCNHEEKEKIECGLDIAKIVQEYNKLGNPIQAVESTDAGRFICEYTYYTSLCIDSSRTLFVHVPDITKEVTAEHIALGLGSIIELGLQQLD